MLIYVTAGGKIEVTNMKKTQEITASEVHVGSFIEPVGFVSCGFAKRVDFVEFVKSEYVAFVLFSIGKLLGLFGGLVHVLCRAAEQVQGALTHVF
jgi:hypothetical protein